MKSANFVNSGETKIPAIPMPAQLGEEEAPQRTVHPALPRAASDSHSNLVPPPDLPPIIVPFYRDDNEEAEDKPSKVLTYLLLMLLLFLLCRNFE